MLCADYRRWFSPYVDGLLEPTERASVEAHLNECSQCRTDLASLQQMLSSLRTMDRPATPDLLPGIHAQLEHQPRWRRIPLPSPLDVPWRSLALVGTAALAAILIVIPAYRMRQGGVKSNADSIGMQFSQVSSQASQAPAKQSVFASLPKSVGAEHMRKQALFQSSGRAQTVDRAANRSEARAQQEWSSSAATAVVVRDFASVDHSTLPGTELGVGGHVGGVPASEPNVLTRRLAESTSSSLATSGAFASLPSTVSESKPVAHEQARQSLLAQPIGADFMAAPLPSDELQKTESALVGREAISTENAPPPVSPVSPIPAIWKVTDTAAAKAEITEWVRTKDGIVVISDAQHLAITLPASAMTDFVRRFPIILSSSTEFEAWRINAPASSPSPVGRLLPTIAPVTEERVPQAPAPQVTISLELVPLQ